MEIKTYRNIRRLRQIISVLVKYGFGWLVKEMRLFPYIAAFERLLLFKKVRRELTTPERLRLILEELGPTFIKLGQVVSTRADLLPSDWIEELKKLQDMVPPLRFEEVKRVVEGSLRSTMDSNFSSFEESPVASASIAQVHYAVLNDGTQVAVKVKRPGIEKVIEADISVMYTIARLLDRYVRESKRYRPIEVVDEFSRIIHKEQDLTLEGSNIDCFRGIFNGDKTVQIPAVYWKHTTRDVLTMERIDGLPFDEVEKIRAHGLDVKRIVENAVRAFFKQVFEHGIFHADLHPGNIFVREDGAIIYLDFGIIGRLDRRLRRYLASMLYSLVRQDFYMMAVIHRKMGLISDDVDIHKFEDALKDITEPLYGRSLAEIDIPGLIMKLIQTARHFKMKLQPNLLLLQKSMVIIEGVGRQLCPDINMWEFARPLIYRWMIREKVSPKRVYERERERVVELLDAVAKAPLQLDSLLKRVLNDNLRIGFVHHKLDRLTREISSLGQRVAFALIASSLIIGSSLIAVFSPAGSLFSSLLPWLGLAGVFFAVILVLVFLLSFSGLGKEGD